MSVEVRKGRKGDNEKTLLLVCLRPLLDLTSAIGPEFSDDADASDLQHTPSDVAAYPHLSCETLVLLSAQPFRQYVRNLFSRRKVLEMDLSTIHDLSQEVVPHFNMLRPIVEFGISCDCYG